MEDEMRHLISPLDFTVEELDQLLETASDIEKNPAKYQDACKGKKIATLFYEPSTRDRKSTRLNSSHTLASRMPSSA